MTTAEHLTRRDEEIVRLYVKQELGLKEVGALVGVSPSTVWLTLERAGVKRRPRGRPSPIVAGREQEIIRAYTEEGLFLKEVGARFGLSPSTVWRVLLEAGVNLRSRSWRSGWPWRDPKRRSEEIGGAYSQEGQTCGEIAARFGLDEKTVIRVLEKAGVPLTQPSRAERRKQEIIRAYGEQGLTLEEVGRRFGLSPSTVRRILQKAGVGRRPRSSGPPKHLQERNDEIARLYAEGDLTLREIGERFNLSHERVRQIGKRAGARPRASSECLKSRNEEIVRLYVEEKLPLRHVGARVGLSHERVRQILRRRGVKLERKRGRPSGSRDRALAQRNEDIIHAYDQEKKSLAQVGALFGLKKDRVSDILREAGVSRRKPSPSRLRITGRDIETVRRHDPIKPPIDDVSERTLQIVHLYLEENLSLKEVATCVGLNPSAVQQTLKNAGVSRRSISGPRLSLMQRNQEIARLYREEGLTLKEIGARVNLSLDHVHRILKKLGVRRGQRGSKKAST
ncbi:MAG: helix-turn-helix domain-containing protein [Dehalococcoidia bacterium]|nr:MAG: helix-turn-helix domain-containing protein [Dehalococcoidia bacterium]